MSSEPPPYPITTTFNEKDWIPATTSGSSNFATNCTNAINTNITSTNTAGTYFPTFVSNTTGNLPQLIDDGMSYNPSTNTLTVGTLIGTVSGNIQTADNVKIALGTVNTDYFPTFVTATGSSMPEFIDTQLKYNPFTNTLTADNFVGTVSGNISTATTADNMKISLGSSNTDYFPTFVTASGSSLPEFIDPNLKYNPFTDLLSVSNLTVSGTLTGSVSTATTASNINVISASANADHFPTFVTSVAGASLQEYADSELKYNPSTNLLTVPNLTVSNTLTATVGSATNATNIVVTDSTTLGGTAYPVFVDGASSSVGARIDTTGMSYNALNNTLSVANFSGTATNASNIAVLPTAVASTHYLTIVDGTTGNKIPYTDAELTYNPSTNLMTVPNLTVSNTLTATVGSSTNATNASNITISTVSTDTDFYPMFVSSTTGTLAPKVDSSLRFNPFSNTLTADTFVGTVSTASNANGINVTTTNVDVDFNPLFVANSGSGVTPITDIQITYNPFTNLLTVPNLTVSNTLTGTVANATNATNMNVNNYTTSAGSFYPTFVAGTGNASSGLDTDLQYTPSNNTLSVVNLSASGTITGTFGGTISNATNAANVYVTPTNSAGTYYPTFVSGNTAGNKPEYLDTDLTYDAVANILTVPTLAVTTISSASNSIALTKPFAPSYATSLVTDTFNVIGGYGYSNIDVSAAGNYNFTTQRAMFPVRSLPNGVYQVDVYINIGMATSAPTAGCRFGTTVSSTWNNGDVMPSPNTTVLVFSGPRPNIATADVVFSFSLIQVINSSSNTLVCAITTDLANNYTWGKVSVHRIA